MRDRMDINTGKLRLTFEIIGCFAVIYMVKAFTEWLPPALNIADSLWWGVVFFALTTAAILAYVVRVEKKPLRSIGLSRLTVHDLGAGVVLGIVSFCVQQIPFLAMGIDYKQFAAPPDWPQLLISFAYILLCVGVGEEIAFRGFILHKSNELFHSRIIAVFLNCVLFYMLHWPPIRFVFGEFFNTSLNTIIWSIYLFRSKKQSIVPLIIAHGIYNLFTSLLPVIVYYICS